MSAGIIESYKDSPLFSTKSISERCKCDKKFHAAVQNCLKRYYSGDWGDIERSDKHLNDLAVVNKNDRIFAEYDIGCRRIFIITEEDLSYTTVLFSSEY